MYFPRKMLPMRTALPHISNYIIWALSSHTGSLTSMAVWWCFTLVLTGKGSLNRKATDKDRKKEATNGICKGACGRLDNCIS